MQYTILNEINYRKIFSVAVLAKSFFIKKNLFHLITTLRCSNIDQEGLPTRPHIHTLPIQPNQPHTPTRPTQRKRRKRKSKKRRRGKGDPHHTTPHTTTHPLTTQTHTTHHTHTTHKGKERKGDGKGGPVVCGLGMMCDMSVGYKRICYGAGEMWCSAGEEKRKRREVKEVEEEKRVRHYST